MVSYVDADGFPVSRTTLADEHWRSMSVTERLEVITLVPKPETGAMSPEASTPTLAEWFRRLIAHVADNMLEYEIDGAVMTARPRQDLGEAEPIPSAAP